MRTDWLPGRRDEQLLMAKTWVYQLARPQGAWVVSQADILQLDYLIVTAEEQLVGLTETNSSVNVASTRQAFSALTNFMRFLHQRKFFSPPMGDSDWVRLGLRVPDIIRTPEPVPSSIPEIEADSSVIRQLSFRLRDYGASRWAKPDHVHGMEFRWDVRESRPEDIEELSNLEVATANPITLSFEEVERGARVFYAARWINNTAQGGPWSDIESAFVP